MLQVLKNKSLNFALPMWSLEVSMEALNCYSHLGIQSDGSFILTHVIIIGETEKKNVVYLTKLLPESDICQFI